MDTFCPTGPYLVPKDYFGDPMNVMLRTWVNGELRQESSTSAMNHDIPTLISVLSLGMILEPGNIFLTGTPSRVGYARPPQISPAGRRGRNRDRGTEQAPEHRRGAIGLTITHTQRAKAHYVLSELPCDRKKILHQNLNKERLLKFSGTTKKE